MTELLSILYKLRIFTLDELSEALKGKVKSVEALLARYKQQGWIVAIRRNTYCMKDIASGLPVCDKYEIGSHLSHTACISYHTAFEFHGLARQPFNEVFVKSMTRFNPFSWLTRQSPWRSLTKTPTIFNGLSFKFATFATWNIKQT